MKRALTGASLVILVILMIIIGMSYVKTDYNVIIITVDTQRSDRLGCYGNEDGLTPSADRLASEGVVFENAFAPVPVTLPSHASLFTGLYPASHGIRENVEGSLNSSYITLAEIMKDNGFITSAVPAAIVVKSEKGLDQGFDVYIDAMTSVEDFLEIPYRRGSEVVDLSIEQLVNNQDDRFFIWSHIYDPHIPYNAPEPFSSDISEPYDAEVAYADECVGRLITYLENNYLHDNTLIIYVGDHGESLGEHGEEAHGYFAYDSALRIPLIIRFPDGKYAGSRISENVSIIDVMPTVLNILGLEKNVPESSEGLDLTPLLEGNKLERDELFFESMQAYITLGWSGLIGCIKGDLKYIRTDIEELYNLKEDRLEENNLIYSNGRSADAMKSMILVDYMQRKPLFIGEGGDVSAEDQAKLASLGYLGGGTTEDLSNFDSIFSGPGLIDSVRMWDDYFDAMKAWKDNDYSKAEGILRELSSKSNGHNYGIWRWLANLEKQKGEYRKAIDSLEKLRSIKPTESISTEINNTKELEKGLNDKIETFSHEVVQNPCNAKTYIDLAKFYSENSLHVKSNELLEDALERCGEIPKLLNAFGIAVSMAGNTEEGISYFQRALKLDPSQIEAHLNLAYANIQAGNYNEAREFLSCAEMINPQNTKISELKALIP